MTPEERKSANDHQLQTFVGGYDHSWRLTKLLGIRYLMKEREKFKKELFSYYGRENLPNGIDNYMYGSATNGLMFSAISELLMYFEDFFAFIKFIREEEYFIKSIVQYWANSVTKISKKLDSITEEELLKVICIRMKLT